MKTPVTFEECMSAATAALGGLERQDLTPEQQHRYEQFCIRAMSLQAKMMRRK